MSGGRPRTSDAENLSDSLGGRRGTRNSMKSGQADSVGTIFDALPRMTSTELRRLRKAAGLTQRALAERLGFHPNYFAQLERGDVPVREVVALAVRYVCVVPKAKRDRT